MGSAAFHCQCHAQQGKQDRCKKPDSTAPCVPGCNVTLGARRSGTFVFLGDWQGELALPTPKLARTNFAGSGRSAFQPAPCTKMSKELDHIQRLFSELCPYYSQQGSSSWYTVINNESRKQAVAQNLQGTAWVAAELKPSLILSSVIDNEKAISNIDNVCGRDGLVQGNTPQMR